MQRTNRPQREPAHPPPDAMHTDGAPQSGLPGFITACIEFITALGARLLVHVCSLVAAAATAATLSLPGASMTGTGAVTFACYVGLVCLIPRGIAKSADWLAPSGAGLALVMFWAASGVPWQFCPIWGGALTWTVRLLLRRGLMSWEWSALPWLLLGLFGFFNVLLPWSPVSPPYWAFPVLAAAVWGLLRLFFFLRGDPAQKHLLEAACATLEKQLASGRLPKQLALPARRLADQGRRLLELRPRLGADTAGLVRDISVNAAALARQGKALSIEGMQQTRARVDELNRTLQTQLQALEPAPKHAPASAEDAALLARINGYTALAEQLSVKALSLPDELRDFVERIAQAAEGILLCMRKDPQDVASGDRFLSRYLKAAHTVVDEYDRLSRQGGAHQSVSTALARSNDLLARLAAAFVEEHAALLRNDTVNFTAELNVLDTLLKMDGK